MLKDVIKAQYKSPKLVKLGSVNMITLGMNQYSTDNAGKASCQDQGHIADDTCHMIYYPS